MGARPTISVLLCVNRSTPYLGEAISSILTQEDGDFEFLIAANACGNDLVAEIEELVSGDPRVLLFRTAIGQLAFNLNYLANAAKGDYLVRMDADDVSEPCRVGRLREALTLEPVDVLGSWARHIDGNGRYLGDFKPPTEPQAIASALTRRTVFCHPTVAIRREFLLSARGYLGGFVSEDLDLWLRAIRSGAVLRNLPQFLLRYRVHGGQSSRTRQGYAEAASHWLREFLLAPSLFAGAGLAGALAKCLLLPLVVAWHGVRMKFRDERPAQM